MVFMVIAAAAKFKYLPPQSSWSGRPLHVFIARTSTSESVDTVQLFQRLAPPHPAGNYGSKMPGSWSAALGLLPAIPTKMDPL